MFGAVRANCFIILASARILLKYVSVCGMGRAGRGDRSAERRLREPGIELPAPPQPFGTYAEAVQTGNLLFLTRDASHGRPRSKIRGARRRGTRPRVWSRGSETRPLNVIGVARQYLGSLDRVTRIVRLGVSVATVGEVREQPKPADAASELLQAVFGKDKSPCRLVYGVASLPLGTPVEREVIFEVGDVTSHGAMNASRVNSTERNSS